jgi:hypothetical protein
MHSFAERKTTFADPYIEGNLAHNHDRPMTPSFLLGLPFARFVWFVVKRALKPS